MLHIRNAIDLVDSYNSEVASTDANILTQNINLTGEGFAEENAQLAAQYTLEPGTSVMAMIKLYTEGSEINGKLIEVGGDPQLLDQRYRAEYFGLMMLNNRVRLGETHHVYSGTGTFNPLDITEGGVFETPAFLSTSLSIKVAVKTTNYRRDEGPKEADSFLDAFMMLDPMFDSYPKPEDHVIHLILQEGFTNGFYIAPYSVDPEELEFLIMPKIKFKHVESKTVFIEGVKRTFHTFIPMNEVSRPQIF